MSEKRPLTFSFPRGESLPLWAFLFSGLMATILGISSVSMLSAAYNLDTDSFGLLFFVPIFAFAFSYIHARKDIRLTLISLGGLILILSLFIFFNFMMAQEAASNLISKISNDALSFLPSGGDYVEMPFAMTFLLALLTAIPSFVCTWALIRKRPIIFVILAYLPIIVCCFSLNYRQPTTAPSVAFILCVLMLFVFRNVRKGAQEKTYRNMLLIMIPLLAVLLFLAILNPQKKYRNDEIARKRFASAQEFVEKLAEKLPWGTGTSRDIRKFVVDQTYSGSIMIDAYANNALSMSVEKEDLLKAGNYNPPRIKFLTVLRKKNDQYNGNLEGASSYMYLKTASMAWFDGYGWSASAEDVTPEDFFTELPITQSEARYRLDITVDFDADYAFIPLYTDEYHIDEKSNVYIAPSDLTVNETRNMNEKALVADKAREYAYAYSTVPVRYTPKWTEEYLDYLYTKCIYVPDETREEVLHSGMLPDWYLEMYYYQNRLPTEKMVEKVVSYVRSLKSYSDDTVFPPVDREFVPWFMTKCETGFCVHYATTTVVLLRMLDIPARYVKGYLLTGVEDDVPYDITTKDAHAWIEFFHPDYGWVMDDPTPGNQTAASVYNFSAIVREYGPETTLVTPRPMPTSTPRPTMGVIETDKQRIGGIEETEQEKPGLDTKDDSLISMIFDKVYKFMILFLVVSAIVLILLWGIRFTFQAYWKHKFKNPNINSSSRGYYRYFLLMAELLKGSSSESGGNIALKATFSKEGITKEELQALIEKEEKNLDGLYTKAGKPRRYLFDIFKIRKKLPI